MENQEKKLGRGLSALIGESKTKKISEVSLKTDNIENIELSKIKVGKYQPRQKFDENQIAELAESIKENGLIQPIILRKAGDDDEYEIIAGERRFRAAKVAGFTSILAIVKKLNNHQALELAIIENVQRADLTIIEEASGYKRLMQEFSYTQEQIATKTGKSRSHIANILRLLSLPKNVQEMLNNSTISMGHARAIINSDNQEELIEDIINKKLSVRNIENIVKKKKNPRISSLENKNLKINFANKDHLDFFEKSISNMSKMKVKVNYDQKANKGNILMEFDDFDKLYKFIEKLEK